MLQPAVGFIWFSSGMLGAGREGDEKSPLKMKGSRIWAAFPSPDITPLPSLLGKAGFSGWSQCQGKQLPALLLKGEFGAGGMGSFGCHSLFPYRKPSLGCPRLRSLHL